MSQQYQLSADDLKKIRQHDAVKKRVYDGLFAAGDPCPPDMERQLVLKLAAEVHQSFKVQQTKSGEVKR